MTLAPAAADIAASPEQELVATALHALNVPVFGPHTGMALLEHVERCEEAVALLLATNPAGLADRELQLAACAITAHAARLRSVCTVAALTQGHVLAALRELHDHSRADAYGLDRDLLEVAEMLCDLGSAERPIGAAERQAAGSATDDEA